MRWKWVQRVLAAVFPWPTRQERKAHIRAAQQGAAEAEAKVPAARSLSKELSEMRRENHVNEALDYLVSKRASQQQREQQ